jgi:hypothetical protein
MYQERSIDIIPLDSLRRPESEEQFHAPLLRHEQLLKLLKEAKAVDEKNIINLLNHTHFTDGHILLEFYQPPVEETVFLKASPEPCVGNEVVCRWSDDERLFADNPTNFEFVHMIIDVGQSMIIVPAEFQGVDDEKFLLVLPRTSYEVGQRLTRRYPCTNIGVELRQNGFKAVGKLVDFSPCGFRVLVEPCPSYSFNEFSSEALVGIQLNLENRVIFTGLCQSIRQRDVVQYREMVLSPVNKKIKRFKKRPIRNPRQRLNPSPILIFYHPLLDKKIQLEVSDISTSGVCVHEKPDEGVLLPGLIIPDLTINFAGALELRCPAQVIYRLEGGNGDGVQCGLAILDMDIQSYNRLTDVLINALDPHAHISSEVNMESLWEFFFKSGFIYPTKYRLIKAQRDTFKETYRKLYEENPDIARHFTYQHNGKVYGHISMVRAYERAWMIHHHAARVMENKRPGFMVLKQVMHYLNDMHRLPSAKIDYVFSYFRPENRFPDRVFGGFARELDEPQGCSLDLFSYLPYPTAFVGNGLPKGWSLKVCSEKDLYAVRKFYDKRSGGLLMDILRFGDPGPQNESIETLYHQMGFLRKFKTFSLEYHGRLSAVLILNQSELGFNLSELLNCIKIVVTDPDDLPWDILSKAVGQLVPFYDMEKVPILIYPLEYVESRAIPYEKQYQLWILNVRYGNEYMKYMQRKFRVGYKNKGAF